MQVDVRRFQISNRGYSLGMRGGLIFVAAMVVAFGLAVPLGGAASRPAVAIQSMKVSASPHTAGAHRVRLTLTFTYQMQCGYPGAGPFVVTFPSSVKLPKRFAAGTVKLSGKTIAAKVKGRNVTVTVPPPQGTLCSTMGPGLVTLTFTHAAKVANPTHAGFYRVRATHEKRAFSAQLVIKPAA